MKNAQHWERVKPLWSFEDVVGLDKEKEKLLSIMDTIDRPRKILFYGPKDCGAGFLKKAFCGELSRKGFSLFVPDNTQIVNSFLKGEDLTGHCQSCIDSAPSVLDYGHSFKKTSITNSTVKYCYESLACAWRADEEAGVPSLLVGTANSLIEPNDPMWEGAILVKVGSPVYEQRLHFLNRRNENENMQFENGLSMDTIAAITAGFSYNDMSVFWMNKIAVPVRKRACEANPLYGKYGESDEIAANTAALKAIRSGEHRVSYEDIRNAAEEYVPAGLRGDLLEMSYMEALWA